MLKKMMSLKCHLVDYEKVRDEKGARLLFFGRYAGLAGMIDSLWALGKRLDWEGIPNPFSSLKQTYQYPSLEEAEKAVAMVGTKIKEEGLRPSLLPFICGFVGYGHVSQGAQEIFDLLPHCEIAPKDITTVFNNPARSKNCLYKVVFEEKHTVEPIDPAKHFELQDYYEHPEQYKSIFESYLPFMILLVNGIYWAPGYPRLVTKKGLALLYKNQPAPRLRVIGDITCDIEGSIECTLRSTQPDNPVFVFDPIKDKAAEGYEGKGFVVLAVDNLPCELPIESSVYFGNTLLPFVPKISRADFSKDFKNCGLPPQIKNAVIVYNGRLTPPYKYIEKYF